MLQYTRYIILVHTECLNLLAVLSAIQYCSLSDSMTSTSVSSAVFAIPSSSPASNFDAYYIQMGNTLVAPTNGAYSTATSSYTCQSTGPHLFSISAGVGAAQQAQVQLMGASDVVSPILQRSGGQVGGVAYNGVTTLARNVLLWCTAGHEAYLTLQSGSITNGPANYQLLSLVVFPYSPKYAAATSWALYRLVFAFQDPHYW
jgi:hypothetical protein